MKKRTTRLCSALLSVLMLSSATTALQANATEIKDEKLASTPMYATGDLSNQMEDTYDGVVIDSAKDYYAIKSNGVQHNLIKNQSNLPKSIDNSQSRFFPEIGNQGGIGSCVGWAQTYYQFTYTMNKSRGITTTEQNSFSPIYTYSLVCGGDKDLGSGYSDVATLMKKTGAAPVSHAPITEDCTNWYAQENVRREALKYRIKDFQLFKDIGNGDHQVTSPDDEDLTAIKTALANEEILTFSTEISNWVSEKLTKNSGAPENDKFYNQEVITKQIGATGGHRMTIVGYNDNIWTDINKNNKIDAGEMGALKIANSWGDGYCNNGFVWFAYDALNDKSCVDGGDVSDARVAPIKSVMRIDVEPYNSTSIYLKFTLSTADRTTLSPYLIAEKDGTIQKSYIFTKTTFAPSEIKRISFDGSTNTTSGTFLFPLDNIVEDISSENINDYTWRVMVVDDADDGKSHTLQQAYIYDESTGSGYYPAQGSYPVTVNNNEATVEITESKLNHAVVYYRGYENPVLNYKVNGLWQSVEMEENTERKGYVHKYVIDLGTSNQSTLYFADINGSVDNNNGSYFTAVKGLNYFITDNVREEVSVDIGLFTEEKFLDVDTGFHFVATATGGYEPYKYKFVTENLQTGDSIIGDWSNQKTSTYFPRSAGNYRITVTVEDYSGNTATKSYNYTVENRPFTIEKAELKTTPNILTGKEVVIAGNTLCEAMQYVGYLKNTYEIEISKNGKVYHQDSVKATKYSMSYRSVDFEFKWIPTEAGNYTVKIYADDKNEEYSEVKMNLTVKDINGTIIGDADNDGGVKIKDATLIQKYCIEQADENEIWSSLADTDEDDNINIKDATNVQLYLVDESIGVNVGKVNYWVPEPTTVPTTVAPTTVQPTTVAKKNIVTFTNSLNWSGNINCYYWSNSNTNMTTWPGKPMTYLTTNDFGQKQYTFDVPSDATYIIFTNGSSQTVDILYGGGEMRYYAKTTTSNGAYEVGTW